jgi:hypothetical protein
MFGTFLSIPIPDIDRTGYMLITNYPHVPLSAGADYAIDSPLLPPPSDAVGAPVRHNAELRLWRLRSRAADATSRRMVPIFSGNRAATSG